jgi:drug/metabolite transporter (DMT)-like permease
MPMESLFVILFSFFIFDDLPSFIKLIGGAGIIIGVVFLVLFRGERNDVLGK